MILFLSIFRQYFNSFHLSDEVNRYLESVSLEQIKIEQADSLIEILNPTTTPPLLSDNLSDPFAPIQVIEE